jgi:hypothetical protein
MRAAVQKMVLSQEVGQWDDETSLSHISQFVSFVRRIDTDLNSDYLDTHTRNGAQFETHSSGVHVGNAY